ncbi:ead/Ea22-like family protein [Citrobacter sp. Marseille-Q3906]|uniref:ead/Ea22-like family protein n=1 Tax=Citrobacter sp. Marseille-Q3906 TaxID=2866574 RepID=UPI001CE3D565|nr:ead/Ea22-like family protein [Citrobacter sp. Marseille-Q3906]
MSNIDKRALREAAEKAILEEGETWWNEEQLASDYGLALHRPDAKFIAAANPATVLALLDELEAADRLIDTLRQDKDKVIDMSIERVNKLLSRAEAAEKRIAELEARTVTLPPKEHDKGTDSQIDINAGFENRMWQKCYDAIRAAGIGVKGE